jgi:hypothetical protein
VPPVQCAAIFLQSASVSVSAPDQTVPLEHPVRPLRSDLLPIAIAALSFSALSLWFGFTSDGFLEADSLTHYLYARFAIVETHYLVNVWGRPLVTGLYAIPAYCFGRPGVHITSLALALICGFVAYAIARRQNLRWPALALVFTLAQPLVFLHSFSELTELPFAALLGIAFVAYQHRQFLVMTILIALSPLARPEGFAFLALAALALIVHRRWWWIPLLAVPVLAWDYLGWIRYGSPQYDPAVSSALNGLMWLKHEWPYAEQSLYKPGSIFHFVMLMPAVASPIVFPALCIGAWRMMRNRRDILGAAIPLLILAAHSVLYATGKMASSGEMRYMAIVAPFWGVLAANGWEWVFTRFHWRHPLLWTIPAAILPVLVNENVRIGPVVWGYRVLPLKVEQDYNMRVAFRAARWYRAWPLRDEYPRVMAAHPGVFYFLDISPTERLKTHEWTAANIAGAPRGTILMWDRTSGLFNSDKKRSVSEADIQTAGWIYDEETSDLINDEDAGDDIRWSIWLSPQSQSGADTASQ